MRGQAGCRERQPWVAAQLSSPTKTLASQSPRRGTQNRAGYRRRVTRRWCPLSAAIFAKIVSKPDKTPFGRQACSVHVFAPSLW